MTMRQFMYPMLPAYIGNILRYRCYGRGLGRSDVRLAYPQERPEAELPGRFLSNMPIIHRHWQGLLTEMSVGHLRTHTLP